MQLTLPWKALSVGLAVCANRRPSRPSLHLSSTSFSGSQSERLLYEHGYHAGSYADVIKHTILIQLLEFLKQKDKPFYFVDTHAGAGVYPLLEDGSMSDNFSFEEESMYGIHAIMNALGKHESPEVDLPAPCRTLLGLMTDVAKDVDNEIGLYPGSSYIAASLCRSQDTLLLFENQKEQFDLLRNNLLGTHQRTFHVSDDNIRMTCDNGYKALQKLVRSHEASKRALVFIDPPYQMGSDTDQICQLVSTLQTHWPTARCAIWHPVSGKNAGQTERLYQSIQEVVSEKLSLLALEMYPTGTDRYVVGTGMILVQPPYGIEEDLTSTLKELDRLLSPNAGSSEIRVFSL